MSHALQHLGPEGLLKELPPQEMPTSAHWSTKTKHICTWVCTRACVELVSADDHASRDTDLYTCTATSAY